ncbi:hypothetical protein D3C73_1405530 [compost metagenome]
MGLAAEVQEDLVGVRGDRSPQGRDRGVAEAGSPSLFHRADHRIHPFFLGADATAAACKTLPLDDGQRSPVPFQRSRRLPGPGPAMAEQGRKLAAPFDSVQ